MSLKASHEVLNEVGAVPFTTFRELSSRVVCDNAIVVVYGTRIVPNWVYKKAHQTINVHWGLSPHYRGILTTDRAIINRDLLNIGFTLHELSNEVDGGGIITQGRVPVEAGDTVGSITTRLHDMARPVLLEAVKASQQAKLNTVRQDLSIGKNYRGIDWTVWTSIKLRMLIPVTQKALASSGPELPIHENRALSKNPALVVASS
jgi:methionyl-tRNA formyltransferase